MKSYKIWICLEEYDDEKDEHNDIDLEFGGTYTSFEEGKCRTFAGILHRIGREISAII